MPETPFPNAEAAWLWTAQVLRARQDSQVPAPPAGPCRAEDVLRCLDRLYRAGTVELLHARVLRIWGWRGGAPNPARPRERCDARLWREAMAALEEPLRALGIVGGPRYAIPAELLARYAAD